MSSESGSYFYGQSYGMRTARNITIDFAFRISHFILLNTLCFVVHAVMSELCSFLCVYFYTDVGASVFSLSLPGLFVRAVQLPLFLIQSE